MCWFADQHLARLDRNCLLGSSYAVHDVRMWASSSRSFRSHKVHRWFGVDDVLLPFRMHAPARAVIISPISSFVPFDRFSAGIPWGGHKCM